MKRTNSTIRNSICGRCNKNNNMSILIEDALVCLSCSTDEEKSSYFKMFNGEYLKIRNLVLDFKKDEPIENVFNRCIQVFETEIIEHAFVYLYLNGNKSISTYEEFLKAFLYGGKSNAITDQKTGCFRHFKLFKEDYDNKIKKASFVNCLNFNDGNGKILLFKPFVNLGTNEAYFLESQIIDLALYSNELPNSTNINPGKNVIHILNEDTRSNLQEFILQKAYSKFCSSSNEDILEIN